MRCPCVMGSVREQKNRRDSGEGLCKGERMSVRNEKKKLVGDMFSISWLDDF